MQRLTSSIGPTTYTVPAHRDAHHSALVLCRRRHLQIGRIAFLSLMVKTLGETFILFTQSGQGHWSIPTGRLKARSTNSNSSKDKDMAELVFPCSASGYSMPCDERSSLQRSRLSSLKVTRNPTEICPEQAAAKS